MRRIALAAIAVAMIAGPAQAQNGTATGDQPVRIRGADQYKAPARFREELLEAMKKKPPALATYTGRNG